MNKKTGKKSLSLLLERERYLSIAPLLSNPRSFRGKWWFSFCCNICSIFDRVYFRVAEFSFRFGDFVFHFNLTKASLHSPFFLSLIEIEIVCFSSDFHSNSIGDFHQTSSVNSYPDLVLRKASLMRVDWVRWISEVVYEAD